MDMPKVMVTGVNGFVGKHLTRELSARECEVVGVGQDTSPSPLIADSLQSYYACDLTNADEVDKLKLDDIDAVISLAGLARVGDSFKNPDRYMQVNVKVLSVLGEKIIAEDLSPRVIAISTGAVYDSQQTMPLTEESKTVEGGSPYVQSKIKMEAAAQDLSRRGLDCVIVRPFNHTGPGQETGFLVPDLYQKIVELKPAGNTLTAGNIDTKRDYTDVRDVVKAYTELALAPSLDHGLYNVCSGKSLSGRDILGWVQKAVGTNLRVEKDESLMRPNDPQEIYGSYERLQKDTGWAPSIPISKTVDDFVQNKDEPGLMAA